VTANTAMSGGGGGLFVYSRASPPCGSSCSVAENTAAYGPNLASGTCPKCNTMTF
jgi:hypothetical protein